MSQVAVVRPEAEAELRQAYEWYQERTAGLGDEFLLRVDACIASIQRNPLLNPVVYRSVRRALLRRFPYGVFYVVAEDAISIIAVLHLSRDPRRWQQRAL